MITSFTIGINKEIVGKCDPQKLSYSGAFQPSAQTMASLAEHISQGYPWMPGLIGGNGKRWQSNIVSAAVMALDFDSGFTIEQAKAHPFIADHAGLIIESSSSTPEHHKFRVVFRLAEPIEGWKEVAAATKYLLHLFPEADQACKDASRFYFGGLGRTAQMLNESARMPTDFAAASAAWSQAEAEKQAEQSALRAKQAALWLAENGENSQVELVQSALDSLAPYKPGEGRYGELSAAIAGICNDLGATGEHLVIAWDGGRGQWGRPIEKWLGSLLRSNSKKAGLGSLFRLAKNEGWKRPKRKGTSVTATATNTSQGSEPQKSDIGADWSVADQHPTSPILIRESGRSAEVSASEQLLTISLPILAAGYDKKRELIDELKKLVTPNRIIYLHVPSGAVEAKVEAARSIFARALNTTGANVRIVADAENTKEYSFYSVWQNERFAEYQRSKHPDFYGLRNPIIVCDQWAKFTLPIEGGVLAYSGLMGVGKSTAQNQIKNDFLSRYPDGLVEIPGYRNALGLQNARKWGIEHISKIGAPGRDITNMLIEDEQSLAYCIDSLNRRARAIEKALEQGRKVCVFLDEADAIEKHLLEGGTLGPRQVGIWKQFKGLLKGVIAGGGYVVAAEANLTQIAVDAIADGIGATVTAVQNIYQPFHRKVFDHIALNKEEMPSDRLLGKAAFAKVLRLLEGPQQSLDEVIADIDSGANNQRVFVATDCQRWAEKLDIAASLCGFKVLRVDGNTIELPEVRAFIENPDSELATHQYDLVVITTTSESGNSISAGYFDNVVLFGTHLEDRALVQMSGRVRGECPLHTFIAQRGYVDVDNPDSFEIDGIRKQWEQNAADSRISSDADKFLGTDVEQALQRTATEGDRFHHFAAAYKARRNISSAGLRAGVLAALKASGQIVTSSAAGDDATDEEDQLWETARETLLDKHGQESAEAEAYDSVSEAKKILQASSAGRLARVRAKKTLDQAAWPQLLVADADGKEVEALNDFDFCREEIVRLRRRGIKAHTFAWLCQNPKIAQIIDLKSWKAQSEQDFIVLSRIKRESAKVQTLAHSVLFEIAELASYDEDTPQVVQFAQWAKERAQTLSRLFGLHVKEGQTNIAIVNKFLRRIGYKSKELKRTGSDGDRNRLWKAEAQPHQQAVWNSLKHKWNDELSSETIDIQGSDNSTSTISDEDLYTKIVDVSPDKPLQIKPIDPSLRVAEVPITQSVDKLAPNYYDASAWGWKS